MKLLHPHDIPLRGLCSDYLWDRKDKKIPQMSLLQSLPVMLEIQILSQILALHLPSQVLSFKPSPLSQTLYKLYYDPRIHPWVGAGAEESTVRL